MNKRISQERDPFTIKCAWKAKEKRKFLAKGRNKAKEKESSGSKIESKQKKKKNPYQDRKNTKENVQKSLWTRQCLNKHTKLSQARKKWKEIVACDTWSSPILDYQNLLHRWLPRPALKKTEKEKSNSNSLVKIISKVIQYRGCWQIFYLNIPSATCKFIYHKFLVSVMIYWKKCLLGTLLLKRNVV